jgi:hypothetical protein
LRKSHKSASAKLPLSISENFLQQNNLGENMNLFLEIVAALMGIVVAWALIVIFSGIFPMEAFHG